MSIEKIKPGVYRATVKTPFATAIFTGSTWFSAFSQASRFAWEAAK